jgi:pullulanase/glycogen debranching enzyme
MREGSPAAHGAIWDGKGTNFTLFSAHATKVEVCLFDRTGDKELERLALPEYTDQILARLYSRCRDPKRSTAFAFMDPMNRM